MTPLMERIDRALDVLLPLAWCVGVLVLAYDFVELFT